MSTDKRARRAIDELIRQLTDSSRLYIASNRGPNEYRLRGERWVVRRAPGGLVSVIDPLFSRKGVAWLACAMSDADRTFVRHRGIGTVVGDQLSKLADMRYVVASPEEFVKYYGTIANELFWPLQHGLLRLGPRQQLEPRFHEAWPSYRRINEQFAQSIADNDGGEPTVLVQDYHLYLVPGMLRAARSQARILHFTHIPWPEPETWHLLPHHLLTEIMESMAAADIIGLQTSTDVKHFLATAATVLPPGAVDWDRFEIRHKDHRAAVRWYGAAPDFAAVVTAGRRPTVRERRGELAGFLGQRTILRVDRLDPAKNLIAGFEAFRRLLRRSPERRADTRMLAWLIPTRTDIHAYRDYKEAVFNLIAEINREFAAPGLPDPIAVINRNDRPLAMAAMQQCDVVLANSIADGMNLVVKETLILNERGVMPVVSRGAGVCKEMGAWLLAVDPYDIDGTAAALQQALEMPIERRLANQAVAREYLREHDTNHWIASQLRDLVTVTSARKAAHARG